LKQDGILVKKEENRSFIDILSIFSLFFAFIAYSYRKFKLFDSLVTVIVSEGNTEEYCGTNVTSSNVNESLMSPIFDYIFFFEKPNLEIFF